MRLTDSQKKAVEAVNGNYLVSAGAGSGKTAVLSQRVHFMISHGHSNISELLILTFTNDAAWEMKKRIFDKLLDDRHNAYCRKAAEEIETSSIMTFDALAYRVVNDYHTYLGLRSDIAIDGSGALKIKQWQILDEILEEEARSKNPIFLDMLYRRCIKAPTYIKDAVIGIYQASTLAVDSDKWLLEAPDTFYSDEHFDKFAKRFYQEKTEEITKLGAILIKVGGVEKAENFVTKMEDVYEKLRNCFAYWKWNGLTHNISMPNISGKLPDEVRGDLSAAKALAKSVYDDLRNFGGYAEAKATYMAEKESVAYLCTLARRLSVRLRKAMDDSGLYDFSTVYHLALKALDHPEVNSALRSKYRFAMVDEYQDTSDLQDAFLAKLELSNVFYVGDIKQSIYRYRNANPALFAKIRNDYASRKGGTLITLSDNFRSRRKVLEGINAIFNKCMFKELGGVDYLLDREALSYGNKAYDGQGKEDYGIEVVKIRTDENSPAFVEASYVANDILDKLNEGYEIYDKDLGRCRPCEPGDFAILMGTRNRYDEFIDALKSRKIPYSEDTGKSLSGENPLMALCSLAKLYLYAGEEGKAKAIRHAYASVRRSFLYMDEDQAIYDTLKDGAFLREPFYLDILANAPRVRDLPLSVAVEYMMEHHHFLNGLLNMKDAAGNLNLYYHLKAMASDLEKLGYGLEELSRYRQLVNRYDAEGELKGVASGNAVKLSTIHKSKGLQFAIIYMPDLLHRFNLSDSKGSDLFHRDYGISLAGVGGKKNLVTAYAMKQIKEDSISEQMRLFYVALTRTEQKLYLIDMGGRELTGQDPMSFRDFLSISEYDKRHTDIYVGPDDGTTYKESVEIEENLPLSFGHVETAAIERKVRPSRKDYFAPFGALDYGNALHSYMQAIDLVRPDFSIVEDGHIRKRLEEVLKLPCFKDIDKAKVYKEYTYMREDGGKGQIDLMLVFDDHVRIIDYKSRDIDDPSYVAQVQEYARFASNAFGKKAEMYLVSLGKGMMKKVE